MDKWSVATRVFAGAWVVLGLILVFKVWAALTGHYAVDWQGELRFWALIVTTSAGFLATRANRSATRDR
ncbi:MAG TPA: hypothetical protein VK066_19040 [Chloroflexota bacterium]|nr:hypothetical protein [Chloroflexota bacterium]